MYNKIIKIISKALRDPEHRLYPLNREEEEIYIVFIFFKYLYEKDDKYKDIKNALCSGIMILIDIENYKKISSTRNVDYKKLFKITENYTSLELLDEVFSHHKNEIGINVLNNDVEKVCFLFDKDINSYDPYGKTTYLVMNFNRKCCFKLIDIMLGVENKYIIYTKHEEYEKYNIPKKTKYVYISNDIYKRKAYKLYDSNFIEKNTMKFLLDNKYVYVKMNYRSISSISNVYLNGLRNIILSNDCNNTAILDYSYTEENSFINIILYDNNKIKDILELKRIIKENKENKNYLIKVTKDEIIENNNRIGFKLYSTKKNNAKAKTINEIVDANTKLTKQLNLLNDIIESEMDKIVNK